ncbi:MAG TPA: hypothetical protein VNC50_17140, partial [Planctomycetia bacterium]|nr:hypothetical protein [Planctomycetia bacterium]
MKRLIAASACALAAVGGAAYFLYEEPAETAPPAAQAPPPAVKPAEDGKIDPEAPLRVEPVLRAADKFPEKVTLHHDGKKSELKFTGSFTRVRPILFVNLHVYEIASYI